MPDHGDVIEITAPVEFEDAGDRLLFFLTSGKRKRGCSISWHKALNAAHIVVRLAENRERAQADRVKTLKSVEGGEQRHG